MAIVLVNTKSLRIIPRTHPQLLDYLYSNLTYAAVVAYYAVLGHIRRWHQTDDRIHTEPRGYTIHNTTGRQKAPENKRLRCSL